MGLASLKAMKRGAQSTPRSARPRSSPPLSRVEGERPHEEGQEARRKTPDPPVREAETSRPQEPEETVLALGAIPPSGDADLGGLARPEQTEEGRAIVALSATPLEGPHGKGPPRPEAPAAGGGGDAPWGKSPVVWPDLDDAKGRARFVLDDPSEAYLCQGLDACGRASVEAINRASELVSRDILRRERVAWVACKNEKAAREAAEGELAKECEISAELRQKCSALATEAREAREKVAPLEKRGSDLTLESQGQRATTERYRGEVTQLEALLAEKDLVLNQAQADLSTA